jgi:hypothetical protein
MEQSSPHGEKLSASYVDVPVGRAIAAEAIMSDRELGSRLRLKKRRERPDE